MNGVFHSAMYAYSGPRNICANEMNSLINHAPKPTARPVDLQSSVQTLCYGHQDNYDIYHSLSNKHIITHGVVGKKIEY